jgi:peptidoglycan/xylan/chitin deacetylase (PgdA/CDA1 family)
MRTSLLTVLVLLLFAVSLAASGEDTRQIAITFDDLPASNIATSGEQLRINRSILKTLAKYKVKATGFVITSRLRGKTEILDLWLKEGHSLGNHTYSHMDFDEVDTAAFQMDIKRGASEIRELLNRHEEELRYFRFPYFHEGDTPQRKKSIREFLKRGGYIIAPVTIHPQDSQFDGLFVKAWGSNDKARQDSIRTAFLQQVGESTEQAELLSTELFGRNVRHVLLLHLNRLSSEVLDRILQYYRQRGYSFVSLAVALKDSVYSLQEQYVGSEELTWLERLKWSSQSR